MESRPSRPCEVAQGPPNALILTVKILCRKSGRSGRQPYARGLGALAAAGTCPDGRRKSSLTVSYGERRDVMHATFQQRPPDSHTEHLHPQPAAGLGSNSPCPWCACCSGTAAWCPVKHRGHARAAGPVSPAIPSTYSHPHFFLFGVKTTFHT